MRNALKALLIAGLSATLLLGCSKGNATDDSGSPDGSGIEIPSIQDAIIEHDVLLVDTADDYDEYQIVYYGHDTNVFKKLAVEVNFKKDAGYTVDSIDSFDIDNIYQNFSTFDFSDKQVYDDGDTIALVISFSDLDDPANLKLLHENGIIQLVDPDSNTKVTAQSYVDVMVNSGARLLSTAELADVNLHFDAS